MGMLRLFLPNNKVQFNVESQKDSVKTPVNMKSPRNYLIKFFRPREFLAEFLGTFIMVSLVKSSAISLSSLADSRAGDAAMLTGGLSAGLAVMVGILVTGESSGAHMNPAVSVGMAIWGRIPLTSLPAYLTGQFLGSFSAAALLLLSWSSALAKAGPAVMASSPVLGSTEAELGLDQGLATFLMVLVACSLEDQHHSPPSLLMGLTVATVTITMGQNAGASMNPAADMMPRLVAALYTGDLSPFHNGNNFWMIPFLVPYLGSVIAVCVYSFFIERLSVTYKKKQKCHHRQRHQIHRILRSEKRN